MSAGLRNSFHEKPYGQDKNHPLFNTAVFSTIAYPRGIVASGWGQIISVDGKKDELLESGLPGLPQRRHVRQPKVLMKLCFAVLKEIGINVPGMAA